MNEQLIIRDAQLKYQTHEYQTLDEMIAYHRNSIDRLVQHK